MLGGDVVDGSIVGPEGFELLQGRQGAVRGVVPQATVEPGVDDDGRSVPRRAAVAVLLGEPPVEARHIVVFLELGYEVLGELLLSGHRARPGAARVIGHARRGPVVIVVGCLDDLHLLGGERRGKCRERAAQRGERCVPDGVVAEADDVVVERGELLVEILRVVGLSRTLGVDHDLGGRATLAHGAAALAEHALEARPVVTAGSVGVHLHADDAVRDLVAHLHVVGRSASALQVVEAILRIIIHACGFLLGCLAVAPGGRQLLVDGIGPGVAVVEVEQELHTGVLDAMAECGDVVEVLDDALLVGVGRIGEEAHADGVPSAVVAQVGQHIVDLCAFGGVIGGIVLFVAGQERDVAAHQMPLAKAVLQASDNDEQ